MYAITFYLLISAIAVPSRLKWVTQYHYSAGTRQMQMLIKVGARELVEL